MAGPSVTVRCTGCGAWLSAPPPLWNAPAWYVCPHCSRPVPVIAPREPPPLFSWEVYPQLYPLGANPRIAGPGLDRSLGAMLLAAAVLLAIVAGAVLVQGAFALGGRGHDIAGHVFAPATNGSGPAPLAGAEVNLSGEHGLRASQITGAGGAFSFSGVPSGRIVLDVHASGFAPLEVQLFASSVYSSPSGNLTNLTLVPNAGATAASRTIIETAFPDLENFVATLWSGSVLFTLAAGVAAAGGARLLLRRRLAWGVAGGMSGALAPLVLVELGVTDVFPTVTYLALVPCALGIAAATVCALQLAGRSEPEPRE